MTDTKDTAGATDPSAVTVALKATGHLLGIAVTAVALLLLAMPFGHALPVLGHIFTDNALVELTITEGAIHLGLATSLWVAFVVLFHQFSKVKEVKTVKLRESGAVLTETIVVLPVMLLIIFGLAQVAVNNIAGMLANVAAYEGARSAWVWAPEINEGRGDDTIDASDVDERSKIAAALVMTPVAPGDYRQWSSGGSTEFENVREAIFKGQYPIVGSSIPNIGGLISTGSGLASNNELRFSKALDESTMRMRTLKKFTHSYSAVDTASADVQNEEIVFDLTYYHYQGFPIVGVGFGERLYTTNAPGNRPGYYLKIERRVKLPMRKCDTQWGSSKLCPPNPTVP